MLSCPKNPLRLPDLIFTAMSLDKEYLCSGLFLRSHLLYFINFQCLEQLIRLSSG